jgi:hypothetical protein
MPLFSSSTMAKRSNKRCKDVLSGWLQWGSHCLCYFMTNAKKQKKDNQQLFNDGSLPAMALFSSSRMMTRWYEDKNALSWWLSGRGVNIPPTSVHKCRVYKNLSSLLISSCLCRSTLSRCLCLMSADRCQEIAHSAVSVVTLFYSLFVALTCQR